MAGGEKMLKCLEKSLLQNTNSQVNNSYQLTLSISDENNSMKKFISLTFFYHIFTLMFKREQQQNVFHCQRKIIVLFTIKIHVFFSLSVECYFMYATCIQRKKKVIKKRDEGLTNVRKNQSSNFRIFYLYQNDIENRMFVR